MKKERIAKTTRAIALILICIFTLSAEECDTSGLEYVSAALKGAAVGLLGSDNVIAQLIGWTAGLVAEGIDLIIATGRQDGENYNPGISINYKELGIQIQNNAIEKRNKQAAAQERQEERKAENERFQQEMEKRFESLPTGTSSVTSPTGEQNKGNPLVNDLAKNDGTVITASPGSRAHGTGTQRVGGNNTGRSQHTTRNDQLDNPNAANNTESRKNGAPGSLDYTEEQPQPTTVTQQATGTTVARAAMNPQITPQIQASTIAEYTPSKQQKNNTTPRTIQTPVPVQVTEQNQVVKTDLDMKPVDSSGKIYYFSVSTGIFRAADGSFEEKCESGLIDLDKNLNFANKTEYLGERNFGPIPPGTYEIIEVRQILHGQSHKNAIILNRISGDSRGRDNDFMIHGYRTDYVQKRKGRNGSNGCILMTPGNREKVAVDFNKYGRGTLYVSE
jgi:hypothetical protein